LLHKRVDQRSRSCRAARWDRAGGGPARCN
jgi:hypothetical protein